MSRLEQLRFEKERELRLSSLPEPGKRKRSDTRTIPVGGIPLHARSLSHERRCAARLDAPKKSSRESLHASFGKALTRAEKTGFVENATAQPRDGNIKGFNPVPIPQGKRTKHADPTKLNPARTTQERRFDRSQSKVASNISAIGAKMYPSSGFVRAAVNATR